MRTRITSMLIVAGLFMSSSVLSGIATAKSKNAFGDYFKGKPTKKDLACFSTCVKAGHSCGFAGGPFENKKTIRMVQPVGDCSCFDSTQ
jgi:hypothetical protein